VSTDRARPRFGSRCTPFSALTKRWKSRIELANAIFDYLEVFHNRQRGFLGLAELLCDVA
jgi:hypothetical protein